MHNCHTKAADATVQPVPAAEVTAGTAGLQTLKFKTSRVLKCATFPTVWEVQLPTPSEYSSHTLQEDAAMFRADRRPWSHIQSDHNNKCATSKTKPLTPRDVGNCHQAPEHTLNQQPAARVLLIAGEPTSVHCPTC